MVVMNLLVFKKEWLLLEEKEKISEDKEYKYSKGGITAIFILFGIVALICGVILFTVIQFVPEVMEINTLYYITSILFFLLGIFCIMIAIRRSSVSINITDEGIRYKIKLHPKTREIAWKDIKSFTRLKYPMRSSQIIKTEDKILYFDSAVINYKELVAEIEQRGNQKLVEEKENKLIHWKEEAIEVFFQ